MTTDSQDQGAAAAEGLRNIVLMLPDGASAAHATNHRYFKGGTEVPAWEPVLKGAAQTPSFNASITDSAGGVYAYATGVKTRNGTVGDDVFGDELATSVPDLAGAGRRRFHHRRHRCPPPPSAPACRTATSRTRSRANTSWMTSPMSSSAPAAWSSCPNSEDGTQPSGGPDLISLAESRGFTHVSTEEELAAPGERLLGLFSE